MKTKAKYVTVRIPIDLADEIDAILSSGIRGYRSRAELIVEATRLRLESIYRNNSMKNDMLMVQKKR